MQSTKSIRIGFFLRDFPVYSETFVIDQINGLLSRGFQVTVYTMRIHEDTKNILELNNINIIVIGPNISQANSSLLKKASAILFSCFDWSFLKKVISKKSSDGFGVYEAAYIKQNNPQYENDVIISHFGPNAVLANHLIDLNVFKGKLIAVFHGYDISVKQILDQYRIGYIQLFQSNFLALPISELWKNKLLEMGCPREKIRVNRMGVNIDKFKFNPKSEISKPLNILTVARHTEKKGIEYAIRAIKLLNDQGISVRYSVAGTGPLYEHHNKLIKELNLSEEVQLLGYLPPEKISKALDEADIFLLPSVTAESGDMEGIPVSLMEAMAKGVCCVSTFHSGIPELIEDNVSGFLAKEKDPHSLAYKIASISKHDLKKILINARNKIKTSFNQKNNHDKLSNILLEDLLNYKNKI